MLNIFLIFLVLSIIYIFVYKIKNKSQENFQINTVINLNKRIEKYLKKEKRKEKNKETNLIKNDIEYADTSKKFLYNNKIVITGATNGIGYYVAKLVNRHQPFLVICGKKKKKVLKVVEELKSENPNVYGIYVDLSKKNGPIKLFEEIYKKVNTVDILINNAVINRGSRFLLSKKDNDWQEELSVNINANILLSQKIAYKMKNRNIKGRIINLSSDASKMNNTDTNSGSDILMKNMIEKYSKLLSEELYKYKIAVTTIRIDENINLNNDSSSIINKTIQKTQFKKYINFFGNSPSKIMPIFMYAIKAPFYEITGKIISTSSYKNQKDLSKIIPPHQIKLNEQYKKFNFTKHINNSKDKDKIYLLKQNPYDMSPNITKFIKKNKLNNVNDISKVDSILNNVIAKNIDVFPENIVLFKNEYECIKKIIDIFVPKYQNIITHNPSWNYINLISIENKIELQYTILTAKNKSLQPDFKDILEKVNSQTKMVYLSSPNIISGQSIVHDDFADFIEKIQDNILVVIDQRFVDFSNKTENVLEPLELIKKYSNLVIIRTFNNFYSIEELELTYIIANKEIANIIHDSQIINPITKLSESLALNVYKDTYYNEIKKKIQTERKRFVSILKKNKIKYYPSETNFILVETIGSKEDIKNELENKNIILYESNDYYTNYWTLPMGTPEINDSIVDVLLYNNM